MIRLGEKIPAKDVEQLVVEHPAIIDAAIIALPDERTGERVCTRGAKACRGGPVWRQALQGEPVPRPPRLRGSCPAPS